MKSFVEDQSGFDIAVGQKEPALQLRQAVSVLGHEEVSFVRLQPPREQRGLPWPETLRLHYFCVMSRPRNISGGARNMTETWLHGLAAPRRRPGNFRRALYKTETRRVGKRWVSKG